MKKRYDKRIEVTADFDREFLRLTNERRASCMSRNIDDYIRTKLQFFKEGTNVYYDRRVVSLKFDKYTRTQQEINRVAKEIISN